MCPCTVVAFKHTLMRLVRGSIDHQLPPAVKQQIHRLGKLGLTVNISEMDVRVSKLPDDPQLRDLAQRQIYHDILAAALSERRVGTFDGIWLWGFTSRHTWVRRRFSTGFVQHAESLCLPHSLTTCFCFFSAHCIIRFTTFTTTMTPPSLTSRISANPPTMVSATRLLH